MDLPLGTAGVASPPLGLRAVTADVALQRIKSVALALYQVAPNTKVFKKKTLTTPEQL